MVHDNLIGQNILGYDVKNTIHSGAFGTVYEVEKTNPSGTYKRALKHMTIPSTSQYISVLNSMGGDESKTKDYFSKMLENIANEIRILNQLSEEDSTHIVRYYENDIKIQDNPLRYDIFILMERLKPLEDFINQNPFTVSDVLNLGLDVLQGLKTCHDNDVIHRDIKEGNIFVTDNGNYKIGDFGVSKILKHSSNAESFKGTPNYLAPEIRNNQKGYTKSVDLYSLGIVLYRLLNYNRNPFVPRYPDSYNYEDENLALEKRMNGEIPDLPLLGGEFIGDVIVKSLKSMEERFQTVDEFFDALKKAKEKTDHHILEENVIAVPLDTTLNSNSTNYIETLRDTDSNNANYSQTDNEHTRNIDINGIFQTQSNSSELQSNHSSITENLEQIASPPEPPTDVPENVVTDSADNDIFDKIILFMPIIIFFIGILAYFIIIPNIYGKSVSFIDWLFSDTETIVATLRNANVVFEQVNGIVAIGMFCWLWLASFILSLFFAGRKLNAHAEPATSLKATKQENCLVVQNINFILDNLKMKHRTREIEDFSYSVKRLENNLSIETDFGYGNSSVIQCENNLTDKIRELKISVTNIEIGNISDNIRKSATILNNINSLLKQRAELKKRH